MNKCVNLKEFQTQTLLKIGVNPVLIGEDGATLTRRADFMQPA